MDNSLITQLSHQCNSHEQAVHIVKRLTELNEVARMVSDPTLKAIVDLYVHRPDNYTSFEHFLFEAIKAMACAQEITMQAFHAHLKFTPPFVHIPTEEWKDMNS